MARALETNAQVTDLAALQFHVRALTTAGPNFSSCERARIFGSAALICTRAHSNGISKQVRKHRRACLIRQTHVHLDRVENLGNFAELEFVSTDKQSVANDENIAQALLRTLQIDQAQFFDCA